MKTFYRVIGGTYKGMTGTPHEISKTGRQVSLMIEGNVVWFPRSDIKRLSCDVINCRNYSWSEGHEYCSACKAVGRTAPKKKISKEERLKAADAFKDAGKSDNPFSDLLGMFGGDIFGGGK